VVALAAVALIVGSVGLVVGNASMRAATIAWMQAGPVRTTVFNWAQGVRMDSDVMLPMPDGTRLSTLVMRPWWRPGPLPTILIRTPYGKNPDGRAFVRRGYAVVVQDMRGRHGSDGVFLPWESAMGDGVATMEWIVRQPWSNGRVGTWGCSALGESQLALARARHPAHRAMLPEGAGGGVGSAGGRYSYFGIFEGGVLQLASGAGFFAHYGERTPDTRRATTGDFGVALSSLPVLGMVARFRGVDDTDFDRFISTPLGDPQWDQWGYLTDRDRFSTPGLHVNGWYDQGVSETLLAVDLMRRNATTPEARQQPVIIGPGTHCADNGQDSGMVGDLAFSNAAAPFRDTYLRWFDRWLRSDGEGATDLPAYQVFVINENRWIRSESWPPAGTKMMRWHLASGGKANTRSGDGRLLQLPPAGAVVHDRFAADPANPVPTRGGAFCCAGGLAARQGPVDQADVESREDVLVYTSDPLTKDFRIVGPLALSLDVATSVRDTDFVAKLVDVWPDGRTVNIQSGVLRLRYRDGITRPQLAEPGQRYTIRLGLRDIAYLVRAGHRLRVQVAGSDFPRLERNLNTGGANFDEVRGVVAENRVYHGGGALSFLELPVLEGVE
jgi:putative CocE/NonD family hydrolase